MELLNFRYLCFVLFIHLLFTAANGAVHDSSSSPAPGPGPIRKLFVFGDSYADTGNLNKCLSPSWKFPYGLTFPGKPSGRFSDGRVLTDYIVPTIARAIGETVIREYIARTISAHADIGILTSQFFVCIAKFLGTKSPLPYQWIKYRSQLHYGMNFAYGGTGVFDTEVSSPNMTSQIDILEKLINDSVYTKADLQSSLVLVTLSGNDYGYYYTKGGTAQGLESFISQVVNQLAVNLKRIEAMGASRIAVTALQPLGCLPRATVYSSFQQCNATENTSVNFHNHLLQQAVEKLNNDSNFSRPVVTILDMYTLFTTVIKNKGNQLAFAMKIPIGNKLLPMGTPSMTICDCDGDLKFENPLKPCCMGLSSENSCGSVDEKGAKLYTLCNNPESAFFWDTVHPTQSGWCAIYSYLKATLDQNF